MYVKVTMGHALAVAGLKRMGVRWGLGSLDVEKGLGPAVLQ